MYSAAHQLNQLDAAEKSLFSLLDELSKPKMIDFIETSFINAATKAEVLGDVGQKAGKYETKTFLSNNIYQYLYLRNLLY